MELHYFLYITLYLLFLIEIKAEEQILNGKIISSDNFNMVKYAFDCRFETQFKSGNQSNGWIGLDFRYEKYITKIEWGVNNVNDNDYLLGVFEAAHESNFEDAIPLYMITNKVEMNSVNTITISLQTQFLYFRYVGPSGSYCKINYLKIFGEADQPINTQYYRPSNLPLIVIHTESGLEPRKNEMENSGFYIINSINLEQKLISGYFQLKGTKSSNYNKNSYYLSFNEEQIIPGFTYPYRNWTLISNYVDKTLLRNLISFQVSRQMGMSYTPTCQPFDVMVNGEYKGTYNLCEKVEVASYKINIDEMTPNDNQEPEISGGYLLEINGFAYLGNSYFVSRKGIPVSIRYPEDITREQLNYITDKFYQLESEIYDNNLTRIDIYTFVRYFILEEIIGNDMAYWSVYLYKKRNDETFYFGPIYDNDMSLENDKRSFPVNCKNNFAYTYGLSAGNMDKLVNRLLKNEEVKKEIKRFFQEIINYNRININYLNYSVNMNNRIVNISRTLNFMKWNILGKKLSNNPKIYNSHEEEINAAIDCINNRIIWLKDILLGIKCEGCIPCDKMIDPKFNVSDDYELDIGLYNGDEGVNFQFLYYKCLSFNIFNVVSIVILILLL
jgi:hypothetical protein